MSELQTVDAVLSPKPGLIEMRAAFPFIRRLVGCGILVLAAGLSAVSVSSQSTGLATAWSAYDRGDFDRAIKLSSAARRSNPKSQSHSVRLEAALIGIYSRLAQGRFPEADELSQSAVSEIKDVAVDGRIKAEVYFAASFAARQAKRFPDAIRLAREGRALAAGTNFGEGLYRLRMAQIFVSKGYDVSAMIWLQEAESYLRKEPGALRFLLDVLYFQRFLMSSKSDFSGALAKADEIILISSKSKLDYVKRYALYSLGGLQSHIGQTTRAYKTFNECLKAARLSKDRDLEISVLSTTALNRLWDGKLALAEKVFGELKAVEFGAQESLETGIVRAVIEGLNGRDAKAEELFLELAKNPAGSQFLVPAWRLRVAKSRGKWEEALARAEDLRRLLETNNFRDGLPDVELSIATANFRLGRFDEARRHSALAMQLVDEIRSQTADAISLQLHSVYHEAFRLAADLEPDLKRKSVLVESLKARLLKDKTSGLKSVSDFISKEERLRLETISRDYVEDKADDSELGAIEGYLARRRPEREAVTNASAEPNLYKSLDETTIVSYFFAANGQLSAFVWDRETGTRKVDLAIDSVEAQSMASRVRADIVNRVFFKRDGKQVFDKLLGKLGPLKKNLVISPDRGLWLIPFQALSPDGESYLIEGRTISYAPSVEILLKQLDSNPPRRKVMAAFANSTFGGRLLRFVNSEATAVAGLYDTNPIINATSSQFRLEAPNADLVHLSMHAEIDRDRALDSLLGFRGSGSDDGRLTVEGLLGTPLKRGSLMFIASCETTNVFDAEGAVGLSWGAMAAGATTVISANWEANDRSTSNFVTTFYKAYKNGSTSSEALQAASKALISNKSAQMHEPYYWASFSLSGDFR